MKSGMEGGGLESATIRESGMERLWRSGARREQDNRCGTEMGDQRNSEDRTSERSWEEVGNYYGLRNRVRGQLHSRV